MNKEFLKKVYRTLQKHKPMLWSENKRNTKITKGA